MFGASQGFGYGDATAPAQAAPQRARQEEKQTCVPVTVRILQDAVSKHADSQEVLIHGSEASIVHLVGVVESLVEQSTMLQFQLNDASGRMKVRHYSSTGASVGGVAQGRYVSIVGNLRTSPAPHVSAMSLRPVASADEVSYHMIDVAHAALRLRNPTKTASMGTVAAMGEPITPAKQGVFGLGLSGSGSTMSPEKQEPPMPVQPPAGAAAAAQAAPKADLRGSVLDVLRKVQES